MDLPGCVCGGIEWTMGGVGTGAGGIWWEGKAWREIVLGEIAGIWGYLEGGVDA